MEWTGTFRGVGWEVPGVLLLARELLGDSVCSLPPSEPTPSCELGLELLGMGWGWGLRGAVGRVGAAPLPGPPGVALPLPPATVPRRE